MSRRLWAHSFGTVLLFLESSPTAKPWQPPSPRFPFYAATLSVRGVTSSISDRAPGHGTYPPGLRSIAPPAASTVELLHGVSGWLPLRALPPTHTHIYSRAATWPDVGNLSAARMHSKSKAPVNSHVPDRPWVSPPPGRCRKCGNHRLRVGTHPRFRSSRPSPRPRMQGISGMLRSNMHASAPNFASH